MSRRVVRWSVLALAGLLLSGRMVSAEFRLPPSDGEQSQPAVAASPSGSLVVVWREHFPDSAQPLDTIRLQRFDPTGQPVGDNQRVDILPGDNARNPAVDMAPDGSFIVVWEGGASEGRTRRTVWARRFAIDGTPRGREIRINPVRLHRTDLAASEWRLGAPAVSLASDGSFVVVWRDDGAQRCNASNISLRRFGADGEPLGETLRVNSDLEAGHFHPAVEHDAEGNFTVVWQQGALVGTPDERGVIVARRFRADGTPVGRQFTVSDGRGFAAMPDLAVNTDGSFTVTWLEINPEDDGTKILARPFAADGRHEVTVEIATTQLGYSSRPSVTPVAGEGFAIIWTTRIDDPWVGTVISAQRVGYDGVARVPAITLGPATCRDRTLPTADTMPNGDVVAVWEVDGSATIEGERARPGGREIPMASPGPTIADRWPALLPTEESFPDRIERRDAARELGCFRHEAAAAAPLLQTVVEKDPDPGVQGAAATALARVAIDPQGVLPVLREACGSDEPDLRSGAARGLGVLGSAAGAPILVRLLADDPSPTVRAAAASALVDIARDPDGAAALRIDVAAQLKKALQGRSDLVRISVLGAMTRLPRPPANLPSLIFTELFDEHPLYALSLIAALGHAGQSAAGEVEKALEHPDPAVRARAIGCLTAVGWGGFGAMLEDPLPAVRAAAANGLRERGRRSLMATAAQLERAARVESDPAARAAIDAAWEALADIQCSEDWRARLEIESRRPEVIAGQRRPSVPSQSHLEQLKGIVSILGTPDGRLKVELASDVFLRTLAGQVDEDGPWFIVYQEECGDFLLANTRRSELRGRPHDELAAFVESVNPGWREHLAEHPEQPYGMPARRPNEADPTSPGREAPPP